MIWYTHPADATDHVVICTNTHRQTAADLADLIAELRSDSRQRRREFIEAAAGPAVWITPQPARARTLLVLLRARRWRARALGKVP